MPRIGSGSVAFSDVGDGARRNGDGLLLGGLGGWMITDERAQLACQLRLKIYADVLVLLAFTTQSGMPVPSASLRGLGASKTH